MQEKRMRDDVISRQAAISLPVKPKEDRYFQTQNLDDAYDYGWYDLQECIEKLPPAQSNLQQTCNNLATDTINGQEAIDALDGEIEITGRTNAEAVKGYVRLVKDRLEQLPSARPERTCVNCGRTVNNGGWYADGRTRCPIEEHYALPKDGYCHLWEKRNVTDDDYPERREE
jgi:hypothetical protein